MEIVLTRSTLRPWRRGDEASLVRHADDPQVADNMRDAFPNPYTLADAQRWIGSQLGVEPPRNFAIVVDGQAAGGIGLRLGDDIFRRSAEVGYWLGRAHWGRGIVSEALHAVVAYGFATFDLARIYAGIFEHNAASRKVLENAGFVFEGRQRDHVTKRGVTMDDLLFGVVRGDRSLP